MPGYGIAYPGGGLARCLAITNLVDQFATHACGRYIPTVRRCGSHMDSNHELDTFLKPLAGLILRIR